VPEVHSYVTSVLRMHTGTLITTACVMKAGLVKAVHFGVVVAILAVLEVVMDPITAIAQDALLTRLTTLAHVYALMNGVVMTVAFGERDATRSA
jgi:hypothetical protein